MRIPDSLISLVDHGIIEEVVRPLMSGKEAQIYLVISGGEQRVAKIYKEAQNRTFQNRADYTEGRKVRNSRDQRAMGKGTRHGRAQNEAAWRSTEVDMIYRLRTAGVRVPVPHHFIDGVLIMELVTDAEGFPAPRLGDLTWEAEDAIQVYEQLLAEVVRMLASGIVHGDLSDFNVLMASDGPVVIDFPQAVDASTNQNARKLLLRDVANLQRFLAKYAPDRAALPYAEEMWELYKRNALTPDTRLTGRYRAAHKPASTEAVMGLIADAAKDDRRRREQLGLSMRGAASEAVAGAAPEFDSRGQGRGPRPPRGGGEALAAPGRAQSAERGGQQRSTDPRAGGQQRGADPRAGGQQRGADPRAGGQQRGADPRAGGQQRGADPRAGGQQRHADPRAGGQQRSAEPRGDLQREYGADARGGGQRELRSADPRAGGQPRSADPRAAGPRESRSADPRAGGPREQRSADPRGEAQREQRSADPRGEAQREQRSADPRGEAQREQRSADPREGGLRGQGAADLREGGQREQRSADPRGAGRREQRSADARGDTQREQRSADARGDTQREQRSADARGDTQREQRSADARGDTQREQRSADARGDTQREQRTADPRGGGQRGPRGGDFRTGQVLPQRGQGAQGPRTGNVRDGFRESAPRGERAPQQLQARGSSQADPRVRDGQRSEAPRFERAVGDRREHGARGSVGDPGSRQRNPLPDSALGSFTERPASSFGERMPRGRESTARGEGTRHPGEREPQGRSTPPQRNNDALDRTGPRRDRSDERS